MSLLAWLQQHPSSIQQAPDPALSSNAAPARLTSLALPQPPQPPARHLRLDLLQHPLDAANSGRSSSSSSSAWRQSMCAAASRLSCKTVMDLNSGLCAAELAWQVQLEQQPARLSVKLSNKQQTRVSFDAQAALRRAGPMLKLSGSPQGIHAASLLSKPSSRAAPSTTTSTQQDGAAAAPAAPTSISNGCAEITNSLRRALGSSTQEHAPHLSGSAGRRSAHPQHGRRRQRQQHHAHEHHQQHHDLTPHSQLSLECLSSSTSTPQHDSRQRTGTTSAADLPSQGQHSSGQPVVAAATAAAAAVAVAASPAPAQLQWEVGWNWKVGGPVASLTKQLADTTSSTPGSTPGSPLALQQVKAAYDAQARSYTLTAAGGCWNVSVVLPTQSQGVSGLLPRMWQGGCWPRLTLSLVPELTCF